MSSIPSGSVAGADPWELAVQFILLFASDTPRCLYQSGNGVDTAYMPLQLFQG